MKSNFTAQELKHIHHLIDLALQEDIGKGDITTNYLIAKETQKSAIIKAKADGVIAGLPIAEIAFKKLDANFNFDTQVEDGAKVRKGDIVVKMQGSYRALLTVERTALNFLQHLSGIATTTNLLVEAIKDYKTEILDTRKTLPAFRLLDKYAVKMGGGTNHRIGLYDMVLIKENHIRTAGSITQATEQIRSKIPTGIMIEVETTNLNEVKEAIEVKADIIMLDNMTNIEMKEAVAFIDGRAKIEASGNVTLNKVEEIAQTGVDFISVGGITHSSPALDLSQKIEN